MVSIEDRKKRSTKSGIKSCSEGVARAFGGCPSRLRIDQAIEWAFSFYNIGRFLDAEQLCRQVLEAEPCQVDAIQLLGATLNQTGRYDEAVQLFREAIRRAPGHAHLHNNLGMALYRLERAEEAVLEFEIAIELRPDFAKAHSNLGAAMMKLGDLGRAVSECREAIRLQPDFKEAYNNLGLALNRRGETAKAIESYERAVELDGEYAEALSNLGIAFIAEGRLDEAAGKLQKAVSLVPNSAEICNNLGVLFNRQGHFEEAVVASEKAIAMRPDYLEAHNNLGTVLMELERFSDAQSAFERAIAISPECAQAHHNRSLILLLRGQFEEGWEEYEWRWKNDGFSTPLRPFSQKWWDGSVEGVGKLLLWGEQGIGDEVQFSGLIRHVISRGIDVVVECDKRLAPLLRRSFPGTMVVKRTDPPSDLFEVPSITHQIPMASIPRALGLSPDSMGYQEPFLLPDKGLCDRFRREYKAGGEAVLVGISWRSGNKQEGPKRSIGLEHWSPILNVEGVRFVNLQYGECSGELRESYNQCGVEVLEDKRVDSLRELEGFAAQVAAMDWVISVDVSTVHFAGAMGIKVWTMLPTSPDWRWGLEGDSTRWYPTMRLFRQSERGNWRPVISRIACELASVVRSCEARYLC